jgi:hypothetical protein
VAKSRSGRWAIIVSVLLIGSAAAFATLRLQRLDWDLTFMIPEVVYDLDISQTLEGKGEKVDLKTYLPLSDDRQSVIEETNRSPGFEFTDDVEAGNRLARWHADTLTGPHAVHTSLRVRTRAVQYEIPPELPMPTGASSTDREHLDSTKTVQSTAPEIVALSRQLQPADGRLLAFARAAFDAVQKLGFKPFKGTTDALTALKLGEASCNGRSRLLAALFRAQGIPARLVGGLVLTNGDKRTSHQWVEARIGAHWVPFDATNDHFAALPQNYLTLYRGDYVLFRHTSDIGFKYQFSIAEHLVPRQDVQDKKEILGLWSVFHRLGIPPDLLEVIVMVPIGAIIIIVFRNVIGLRTYGTFLPTLIAASMRHTGMLWGLVGFLGIIVCVALIRKAATRLELLHSPQLAALLTAVIGIMLLVAWYAAENDLPRLARITLFPFAITAITAERFSITWDEEGAVTAWLTLMRTAVVVAFCYVTMNSLSLQILMLGFPELLLFIIAIDIWLGRWVGLRMTEWLRFRGLLLLGRKSP